MNVTLPIPDELATRLGEAGDVSRRALEAFAADEYRAGRLSHPELRSLLGFATHAELDGFLKARGIFEDYTQSDLDRERQTLDQLGL
jgi:hypothetical protein